ncbi:MAG: PAS domain S-box protein [Lentisphaeria bacterium]|nr:PAS domain S-box protein [Lentisphaeria bacterium]
MEYVNALVLNTSEMIFIFISLMLLLQQRKAIGFAPFYMAFGFLLFLSHILVSAELRGTLFYDVVFNIGMVIVYMPLLAAFLAMYITCGTLRAQHFILGVATFSGLLWYIGELTELQCNWLGFSISNGFYGSALNMLLGGAKRAGIYSVLGVFADLLIVPIIYTLLDKLRIPKYLSILGSMLGSVFSILPEFIIFWYTGVINNVLLGDLLGRILAAVILSGFLAVYIKWLERDLTSDEPGALDLLFAFVGSYGKAKELQVDLEESEKRYKMVIENAGELIFTLQSSGVIIDANIAALRLLGLNKNNLSKINLFRLLKPVSEDEVPLENITASTRRLRCSYPGNSGEILLDISLTPVEVRGHLLFFLIARDITEEEKLANEKAELASQLIHSQRLEALGRLAGGVAHDFNNCIHAILGHTDMLLFTPGISENVSHRLQKIAMLAEQAGKLTSQLLGFARKGKYKVELIDIRKLVDDCVSMTGPQAIADIEISVQVEDGELFVSGDGVQLHQVLLNLILNAIDAMKQKESDAHRLTVKAGNAVNAPIECTAPVKISDFDPSGYVYISVSDTGCGMSQELLSKIFEPFYTTKPVGKGTGMGLAMVYGTITHHQGWVQVESSIGGGSTFCCFLPLEKLLPGEKENA